MLIDFWDLPYGERFPAHLAQQPDLTPWQPGACTVSYRPRIRSILIAMHTLKKHVSKIQVTFLKYWTTFQLIRCSVASSIPTNVTLGKSRIYRPQDLEISCRSFPRFDFDLLDKAQRTLLQPSGNYYLWEARQHHHAMHYARDTSSSQCQSGYQELKWRSNLPIQVSQCCRLERTTFFSPVRGTVRTETA